MENKKIKVSTEIVFFPTCTLCFETRLFLTSLAGEIY